MTTPRLSVPVRGKGRHYENPRTGERVPSVTNALSILDKPALPRWSAGLVAKKAYEIRHELLEMDEDEAVKWLRNAPWRKSEEAADRGTTIHEWLEKSMLGEELPELTGEAIEYESAAHRWLDDMQPEPVRLEATMFGDGYAGTADGIVRIDGQTWLIDFKTSKALYESAALQLAALWGCNQMVTVDYTSLQEVPEIDRVAAIRIGTEGVYEMVEVVDLHNHWTAFNYCLKLWEWKHNVKPYGDSYTRRNPDEA